METIGRVPTVEGSKPLLEYFGVFRESNRVLSYLQRFSGMGFMQRLRREDLMQKPV